MDPRRRFRGILFNSLATIAFLGGGVYFLISVKPLILPIILGVLLAYLFKPLKKAFKYRWLPNSLRVTLIFLLTTAGILISVKFVKDNVPSDFEKLEIQVRLKYKFNEKFEKMMGYDPATGKGNGFYNFVAQDIAPLRLSFNNYLALTNEDKESFLGKCAFSEKGTQLARYCSYFYANNQMKEPQSQEKVTSEKVEKVQGSIENPSDKSFVKTLINILSIWFIMPIVCIFFLMDEGAIAQFFIRLVPNRYFELSLTVLEEVDNAIGKYLRGISMECALVGITMIVGLILAGFPIKMAVLVGILSGLATGIPMVGPVVGLSLSLTYALIAEESFSPLPFVTIDNLFVAVLIVNGVVVALDNAFFQPIVLGSAVNLHPLVVILGIMSGSMLFGMAGVLLAIPTIVVFKSIIQHTFRGLKEYRII